MNDGIIRQIKGDSLYEPTLSKRKEYNDTMSQFSGNYQTNNVFMSTKPNINCFNSYHNFGNQISNVIDKESELRSYKYDNNYKPVNYCTDCPKCNKGLPCNCSHCVENIHGTLNIDCQFLISQPTRLDKKNERQQYTEYRFDPVTCVETQRLDRIHDNSYIGISSRLANKESIRRSRRT